MASSTEQSKLDVLALDVLEHVDLVNVLQKALQLNFQECHVSEVDCPDLRESPWDLASSGLCGDPVIMDIGGPDNIHYIENNTVSFDLMELAKTINKEGRYIMGPGAGAASAVGLNAELMANVHTSTNYNASKFSKVTETGGYTTEPYPSTTIGVLANLMVTHGLPGKVIRVHCKNRIGNLNFVSALRKCLAESYPDKSIGLGGSFLIKSGKFKAHVMPDFCGHDLLSNEEVDNWLKFYEMRAPVTSLCVMVSNDLKNMGLRMEHAHFFSNHGDGGHYHYDTTPEEVEYEGYFVQCHSLYRVARPTHSPSRTNFKR